MFYSLPLKRLGLFCSDKPDLFTMLNSQVFQEIEKLSNSTIAKMKADYRQGTGLTLRDITFKYNVTFATACYILKSGN